MGLIQVWIIVLKFFVRYAMEQVGVDLCIDVHGDEGLPYNFFSFPTGSFSYHTSKFRIKVLEECFLRASPDFQTKWISNNPKRKANLGIYCQFYRRAILNVLV